MRLLFVKHSLLWPRSNGHDVHTFHMMKACAELGHEVWLATVVPPQPPAVDGLKLAGTIRLSAPLADDNLSIDDTWFQRRFRSFWGVDEHWILALRQAVARITPEAVIVAGMDALPFLVPLKNTIRVWYAADELVWHHLSQLTWSPSTWRRHGTNAAYRLMYERSHRKIVDRAWVVSDIDARAMRRIAGVATIDVLPNGVDSVFFAPGREIHIEGPGTDLRLNVEGRTWVNSDGKRNMPSGEVFTGPHETSAEGVIRFTIPTAPRGVVVEDVTLEFREGRVVGAKAERGDAYLQATLETDAGAHYLGELGIGTNFGIDRPIGAILFDEKIGGTVHLAIGRSYPETGGTNESVVHWDMICDLRQGGTLSVDGEPLLVDGRFRT